MKRILAFVFTIGLLALLVSATIDLNNLDNYANQSIPNYITKDNTNTNFITDEGATLGRVLFYDINLSANNTIACASCHKQQFAFSDTAIQSIGLDGGKTGRHSMRLVNARYSDESKFFWDERAQTLEAQTSQPIQDHIEMGFSGTDGQPGIDSLIRKLSKIEHYTTLFKTAFGDSIITEQRMQLALSQFIRSIISFDSKFDIGRAQVNNVNQNFPNFTTEENTGKTLFLDPPAQGGAGCQGCHRAPEFDIDPNSGNNNVIGTASADGTLDLTNTRAPSLRDLFNPQGVLNGGMMHTGRFTIEQVINHYNRIVINAQNNNLDNRLRGPSNQGQVLNLTDKQKLALIAFLKTLTGSNIYTNTIYSSPFDANNELTVIPKKSASTKILAFDYDVKIYPNPTIENITIENNEANNLEFNIYNSKGQKVDFGILKSGNNSINLIHTGLNIVEIVDKEQGKSKVYKVIKK